MSDNESGKEENGNFLSRQTLGNFRWDGFEVISSYTRADALADGILVDATEIAANSGYKIPVAINERLFHTLGDGIEGVEALLNKASASWKDRTQDDGTPGGDYGWVDWNGEKATINIGGGDDGNAVFTIYFLSDH